MKLKIFHWIDGPPDMHIDSGWNWRLEDETGKVRAENPGRGFKSGAAARADAVELHPGVEVIDLGKWNPDDPKEYVNGKYAGEF
jgi:hypothetical protein